MPLPYDKASRGSAGLLMSRSGAVRVSQTDASAGASSPAVERVSSELGTLGSGKVLSPRRLTSETADASAR